MAGQFLASHGIDLDAEMERIQASGRSHNEQPGTSRLPQTADAWKILGVRLPRQPAESLWDINLSGGKIANVQEHQESDWIALRNFDGVVAARGQLLAPSLCHAHIHLDKCFLLQYPKFADLQVKDGSFQEAMDITSKAKARFEIPDLMARGRRLIKESIRCGVTAMRAFVEVDDVVQFKCLRAAMALKREFLEICDVQICAFAQHALFSGPDHGNKNRELVEKAAWQEEVDVLGSTPYVEADLDKMKSNIEWIVSLSKITGKHLDLHLDYHLDKAKEPLVCFVLETLKANDWSDDDSKTCVLGHCTRLTYFSPEEWKELSEAIEDLNVHFLGLPTSDLYMMRTDDHTRGTLMIPELIKDYGFEAAIGVNNVGNAFTPQGSCDPLSVANLGMGIYHAGSKGDAELLYVSSHFTILLEMLMKWQECVSQRAKRAMGYKEPNTFDFQKGEPADFVLFGTATDDWKSHKSIPDVVYDPVHVRRTIKDGLLTSR
ncbi:MAG: hypothetical protein M1822_007175 [Bathelium mastoideum]|nr:MAG: hypothetical protein M1822_007175 [Bathelium mastoideum]